MDKKNFIKEFGALKMSYKQRDRFLKLINGSNENKNISSGSDLLTNDDLVEKSKNSKIVKHAPKEIVRFLNKFRENTALKFSTHNWDTQKYETFSDFLKELEDEWKQEKSKLFNRRLDLHNLINYFVGSEKMNNTKVVDDVPEYGWSSELRDIKIGWQFPANSGLAEWAKQNYDKSQKSPFEFLLPEKFRPNDLVKGKEILKFGDVVELFKHEIQFRENDLFKAIRRKSNSMKDFNFKGIDSLKGVSFYTQTSSVIDAINKILEVCKSREFHPDLLFEKEIEKDYIVLKITQLNSNSDKILNTNNPGSFLGGDLTSIASSLFNLADFSIISRFNTQDGSEKNAEIEILHGEYDTYSIKNPNQEYTLNRQKVQFKELDDADIKGFTYKMKFYI
ncbi:hypothetical protein EDL98_09135 [Ornithobacterium rhinotracheale]|uniref:hypothetical protein n=1 Tax=Ornithobacterium rhinotracheale TaxID=28251 RepID=UPI00129CF62D|nr:hypothetical protein [Ornithobacterium rhinotracheale]MRJ11236.1 hypothetical protein [Ornithobacterium rhinotracheale]